MSNGIILRSTPYKENDLILTILSDTFGKLSAYQRSAKRAKSSTCEVFDCGKFEFKLSTKGMARIGHFLPRNSFSALRNNLDNIAAATFVCELFDFLVPENDESDASAMYSLLYESLSQISSVSDPRLILRQVFLCAKKLISHAGIIDPDSRLEPSSHNLQLLIKMIERYSERKLRSTAVISDMVNRLKN